jgi:hypothetical protein
MNEIGLTHGELERPKNIEVKEVEEVKEINFSSDTQGISQSEDEEFDKEHFFKVELPAEIEKAIERLDAEKEINEKSKDPIIIIEGLRQQIYMMGANDSENSQVNAIVDMYKRGEIEGEEAIQKVTAILNNKQDYH